MAAERHLRAANSDVEVEGVVADFDQVNAEKLVTGAGVIVDGLDNFDDALSAQRRGAQTGDPWVYGGAIQASGMTATFLPGGKPCFRCLVGSPARPRESHLRHRRGGQCSPLGRRFPASGGGSQDLGGHGAAVS